MRSCAGDAVLCWGYSLESGGREAVLDEIYGRGLGLGSAAMPALLAACRAAGVQRVFLETEAPNDAARRFYARHGFQLEQSIWLTREL
ncbi:GNAT family N-acetyltransferase [Pseudofrankia sp. DC12]|uniref:GNAT family N-acetyltransferase n=1 Tax=Pseudofrankia sp. DC12 TaxID=683315 RepID=UPI001E4EF095|nr:GNAT family N-acetyltransferase [Pseudofrankia sp. DC12]